MASTQNPNALAWGQLHFTGENLGPAQRERETIVGLVLASTHLSLQPPEWARDYTGTGGLHLVVQGTEPAGQGEVVGTRKCLSP